MRKTPNHRHRQLNPILAIWMIIISVFLTGEAFFYFIKHKESPRGLGQSAPDSTSAWQTFTNATERFSFQHPGIINGPATIREDLVEIYEEVDGLLLLINTIDAPDPSAWLKTRTAEDYSQKPLRCFAQTFVTDIKSAHDRNKTLLHFNTPVLFLDNIDSTEGKRGSCADTPRVRVALVLHRGKILRITFSGNDLSEHILSTFKFTD